MPVFFDCFINTRKYIEQSTHSCLTIRFSRHIRHTSITFHAWMINEAASKTGPTLSRNTTSLILSHRCAFGCPVHSHVCCKLTGRGRRSHQKMTRFLIAAVGSVAMATTTAGQVCSAYDHGVTTYSQGTDPTMATIVMLVFMGALVLCAYKHTHSTSSRQPSDCTSETAIIWQCSRMF